MIATKQTFLAIATCGLLTLTGCAKYTPKSKAKVVIKASQYIETQDNLTVTVKKLTPSNQNAFTKKKIFRRYVPIEITFNNKSNNIYKINRNDIGAPLESPEKISHSLYHNPLLSLIWPFAVINPLKIHILSLALIIGKHASANYVMAITLPLAISSIFLLTYKENKHITKAFLKSAMNLKDNLYIQGNQVVTKLIYIKKDYFKPKFYIVATNTSTGNESQFRVNLG